MKSATSLILTFSQPILQHYHIPQNAPKTLEPPPLPSNKYCPDLPEVILRAAPMSAAERKRWQIAIQVLAGGVPLYVLGECLFILGSASLCIGGAFLYISFLSFLFF